MKAFKFLILLPFILFYTFFGVLAQDDASYLKYRQNLMKANGMYMGMIGDIMKSNLPLKNDIELLAKTVENNGKLFISAWEKKITAGQTDSKPEIWEKWDQFVQAANKSAMAANSLSMAGASGDSSAIGAAMKNVGGTCGGCHKDFRKPMAERFSR